MIMILNSICLHKDKLQILKISIGADQAGHILLVFVAKSNMTRTVTFFPSFAGKAMAMSEQPVI